MDPMVQDIDIQIYKNYELSQARSRRDEEIEELMLSLIPNSNSRKIRVLDAGCGYGTLTTKIGRMHECVGIDISSEQIHQAQKRTVKRERVWFIVGDVRHMPFKSGSFDFIVTKNLLEHCRSPFDVLLEFQRVLRLGGGAL